MRSFSRCLVAVVVLVGVANHNTLLAQQRARASDPVGQRLEGERDRSREGDRAREREGDGDAVRGVSPRLVLPHPELPRPGGGRRWYLGVEVAYRDFGAQISRVERNSPAQRAGLEVRDVIVTVGGYQVGRVDGRLFTLERELELRADRRGRVSLLVQDHRNSQLTPLPVTLAVPQRRRDPLRTQAIIGTINGRRLTSLARDAELTVRLLDVSGRRLTLQIVAQRTYRKLGPLPLPFELEYDAEEIEAGRKYAMEAVVTVNGLTVARSAERYPVLSTDRQGRVNMELVPARGR